jgi:hypothetical protein
MALPTKTPPTPRVVFVSFLTSFAGVTYSVRANYGSADGELGVCLVFSASFAHIRNFGSTASSGSTYAYGVRLYLTSARFAYVYDYGYASSYPAFNTRGVNIFFI